MNMDTLFKTGTAVFNNVHSSGPEWTFSAAGDNENFDNPESPEMEGFVQVINNKRPILLKLAHV